MATQTTKSVSASAVATTRKVKATLLPPVPLRDNILAQGLSVARPAALLALLYLGFGNLVGDPAKALQWSLPIVAVIQTAYAVVGLPVAGSQGKSVKKPRPGGKKKADAQGPSVVTAAALSLVLSTLSTPFVHILSVLFGAPFLTHIPHTMLLAAHFSLLGLFPVFYARGIDRQVLVAVAGIYAPLDEPFGALVGAVAGGWLGAIPIPLDWDREWQKWPVTVLVGVYMGSVLGSQVAGRLLYGKTLGSKGEKEE